MQKVSNLLILIGRDDQLTNFTMLTPIESCFDNLFEKQLNYFKKKTFHNWNMELWEHFGFVY
jgi:hypothetical protein